MKITKRSGVFLCALAAGGCADLEDPLMPGEESLAVADTDPGVPGAVVGVDGVGVDPAPDLAAAPINALTWTRRPGGGQDVGAEYIYGSTWLIGANEWTNPATGTVIKDCFQVHKWRAGQWLHSNGCGKRISVEWWSEVPWIVNHRGEVWYLPSPKVDATGNWVRYPNVCAKEIAAGNNGDAWAIGCVGDERGNYTIYRLDRFTVAPPVVDVAGRGVKIAMGPYTRVPWLVTHAGIVYRRTSADPRSGGWAAMSRSGRAYDLTVGRVLGFMGEETTDERVWVVSRAPVGNGDFRLQYRSGSTWYTVNGGGRTISAYSWTQPWITNTAHSIYEATGWN